MLKRKWGLALAVVLVLLMAAPTFAKIQITYWHQWRQWTKVLENIANLFNESQDEIEVKAVGFRRTSGKADECCCCRGYAMSSA